MKNRSLVLFLMLLFAQEQSLFGFDIKGMFEDMGTSFGASPKGYTTSFSIWSDASVPIFVEQKGLASLMGAYFPSHRGMYGQKRLKSIFEANGVVSKAETLEAQYYFKLYVAANADTQKHSFYAQSFTQLPLEKFDPNIFYHHVYTTRKYHHGKSVHVPALESMGYRNPSAEEEEKQGNVKIGSELPSLSFYNNSGTDVQVSLTYGKDPYKFTVEKRSYNSLMVPFKEKKKEKTLGSDTISAAGDKDEEETTMSPEFSLRPNTITFSAYNPTTKMYDQFRSLMLPSQGFDGSPYTIEIYQDHGKPLEVGIQGLNPGNYDVASTERVRELTPSTCTFWHQSFKQTGSVAGYRDLPGQVWVVYAGGDNPIQSKVEPGQVVSWSLTRPLISQGDQFVYFVYVVTMDDAIAQKFVEKVASQMLGKNVTKEYEDAINVPFIPLTSTVVDEGIDLTDTSLPEKAAITASQKVKTLMGKLTVSHGVIEDVEQDTIGYLLGTDVFLPKGVGSGDFYYVLSPSVINVNGIVSLIFGCCDLSKMSVLGTSNTDIQKSLILTVEDWLAAYVKKTVDVKKEIEKFLLQYGNSKVVDEKAGVLTKFGQNRAKKLFSGSASVKYPPMKLSTVTNQYVYDFGKSAPNKMPKMITKLKPLDALVKKAVVPKVAA